MADSEYETLRNAIITITEILSSHYRGNKISYDDILQIEKIKDQFKSERKKKITML